MTVIAALLIALRTSLRTRAELQLENLALRHQLQVLSRTSPRRARRSPTDRRLWNWLARVWRGWRVPLMLVDRETFCHFTLSNEWTVQKLSYVLFDATVPSGVLKVRVCVATPSGPTCGVDGMRAAGTVGLSWAVPPTPLPSNASGGAYLEVTFPPGAWSLLKQVMPFWHP
jgi:hypothetical protein